MTWAEFWPLYNALVPDANYKPLTKAEYQAMEAEWTKGAKGGNS